MTSEIIHDPVFGTKTILYTYDAVGNRLTKTENGTVTSYLYDDNDRLLTESSQLTVNSYQYDNNGNTISKTSAAENISYGYDYNNRLIQVDDGSTIVEYQYDTDGMRVQKKIGNEVTNFLLDKNRDYAQVLRETDGSGNTIVSYTYGNDLISQDRNSSLSYYHYDGQLSTRQLTDATAQVTDTYTYDAFGLLLNRSGSTENHYMYTGEQYDPNVGFYYLRARYYNPEIGRFHTMDTWPGMQFEPMSLHKYLYCHNSPIDNLDPSGLSMAYDIRSFATGMVVIGILAAAVIVSFIAYMSFAYNAGITLNLAAIAEELEIYSTVVLISVAGTITHIYLSEQGKQAAKHIDGAKDQVFEHLNKIGRSNPNDPNNKDWLKHIRKHLRNIKKYAERLGKKAKAESLKFVEEQASNLKDLADKWGVPWDI